MIFFTSRLKITEGKDAEKKRRGYRERPILEGLAGTAGLIGGFFAGAAVLEVKNDSPG